MKSIFTPLLFNTILYILINLINTDLIAQCSGNYIFNNQSQINSFPNAYQGCDTLVGNLTINGTTITNLDSLYPLTMVTGNLIIENVTNLQSLNGLHNLENIGSSLFIIDCDKIEIIDKLTSLQKVGKSIHITNNLKLDSLSSFANLNVIGEDLYIINNDSLLNMHGLLQLDSIYGNVEILANQMLTNLNGLNNLKFVGNRVKLSSNNLVNLQGLTSLTKLNLLQIQYSSSLLNLSGTGLVSLNNLIIEQCNNLHNLMGLENVIVNNDHGNIIIINNQNLTSLTGNSFYKCNYLDISFNPLIINVNGLEKLKSVSQSISFRNNNNLTNLDSLKNLLYTNLIKISGNQNLNSIYGIRNLSPCSIMIENNPLLDVCANDFVCASIFKNINDVTLISNSPNCSNVFTLRNQCVGGNGCLTGNIILKNQMQVDTFLNNYPSCVYLNGNLIINNSNLGTITNLNSLNKIKAINGDLIIDSSNVLLNYNGLVNLKYLKNNLIIRNSLTNDTICDSLLFASQIEFNMNGGSILSGLNRLRKSQSILIVNNNYDSLNILKEIVKNDLNFLIANNHNLIDLGFSNFSYPIDLGYLEIINNDKYITSNPINPNIVLPTFESINISENDTLHDLNFLNNLKLKNSSAVPYLNLEVIKNKNLSDCTANTICHFLQNNYNRSKIFDNDSGCNSRFEIKTQCNNGISPIGIKFTYIGNTNNSWTGPWHPYYPGTVIYFPDTILIPSGKICELNFSPVYNIDGIFKNYGTFSPIYNSDEHPFFNFGQFTSYNNSLIINTSPFYNYGDIELQNVNWQMEDSLVNYGKILIDNSTINHTDITNISNYDTFTIDNNSTIDYYVLKNNSNGLIRNVNSKLIQKMSTFSELGNYGTFKNDGIISLNSNSRIKNYNSSHFINNDSLILNAGSTFSLLNNSTFTLNQNSLLINNTVLGGSNEINNSGTYKGSGIVTALFNSDIHSKINPGLSPGCPTFTNNLNISGEIFFEIFGLNACSQFDQIKLTNGKTVNVGGKLYLDFGNFNPVIGQQFQIFKETSGNIIQTGNFDTIIVAPNIYKCVFNNKTVTVTNVKKYYYQDLDLDNFGTSEDSIFAFIPPQGFAPTKTDCDDNNNQIYPGASELCNNGIDDNCNNIIDETMLLQGLTAWYPFNGNANDESDNDNHGTVTNATLTTDRFNHPDSAYFFNGTNARIDIANNPSINHSNISISTWIHYSSIPSGAIKGLITKQYNGNSTYYLYWENGRLKAFSSNGTSSTILVDNTTIYPAIPTWLHIAFTFDDLNNTSKFYVNGILVATGSPTYSLAYNSNPIVFGAGYTGSAYNNFYSGKLDDIRIYDFVLSGNQILHVMNDVAPEICNNFDDDCDGVVDDGVQITYFNDLDNDSFGNSAMAIQGCSIPNGFTAIGGDCDDNNNQIYPGASELCNNGIDDNCNNIIDETMLLQGLTAWYPFNGNANDESNNDNHGTVTNATLTTDRFNHPDSAYFFNGTNARIDIASNPSINHSNISISAWIHYSSIPSGGIKGLITKQYNGNSTYYLYWENGRLKAFSSNGTSSTILVDNTTIYPAIPTWLHIAFTFDDLNNTSKFYVNGILVATGSPTYSLAYNSNPIVFGAGYTGSAYNNFYFGKLDDIRIYDFVLSGNQILHVMNDVAPEICNNFDDDCDGVVDDGLFLINTFTNSSNNNEWATTINWSQNMLPTRCHDVIINNNLTAILNTFSEIRSLEVSSASILNIQSNGILNIFNGNSSYSVKNEGNINIFGILNLFKP